MLSNLRTEGMAVEDGPRLSGRCVSLESMLHPPRHRGRGFCMPHNQALAGHPFRHM
jgi:hypothetical protein